MALAPVVVQHGRCRTTSSLVHEADSIGIDPRSCNLPSHVCGPKKASSSGYLPGIFSDYLLRNTCQRSVGVEMYFVTNVHKGLEAHAFKPRKAGPDPQELCYLPLRLAPSTSHSHELLQARSSSDVQVTMKRSCFGQRSPDRSNSIIPATRCCQMLGPGIEGEQTLRIVSCRRNQERRSYVIRRRPPSETCWLRTMRARRVTAARKCSSS